MRIIAGEKRGTRLTPFDTRDIRPTPDAVREAVFNILASRVEGANVLAPFAGTGAMGLEALSRGAEHSVFVENARAARQVLEKNIQRLGYEDRCAILRENALHCLPALNTLGRAYDLVFIDPPYRMTRQLDDDNDVARFVKQLADSPWLARDGIVMLDHPKKATIACDWSPLEVVDTRRYGQVGLIFLRPFVE